jgi:hypothetical protein
MSNVSQDHRTFTERKGPAASGAYDFSLVLGGPLFQLFRRAHLCGNALELVRRRIIVFTLITWVPLLVLSVLDGRAWGSAVKVPFVLDIDVHLRFLLALPLLIAAELVVHQRLRLVVDQFVERGLISPESRARFEAAIAGAFRLRNSVAAEVMLIAIVYLVGVRYLWPNYGAFTVPTWYADPVPGGRHLSPAGWWFVFVSLPVFRFLLLRWYYRLLIWIRLLWQISRCRLSLVPTHPDYMGGLGFLSLTPPALAPLLAAHGVALAGMMANQIFFHGAQLLDFKVEVAVIVAFLMLLVLAPMLFFVPDLAAAKRAGLRDYGTLAQRYVRDFDDKWLRGAAAAEESLMGSADIQSLADMGNSFQFVRGMRLVPVTRDAVIELAVVTLAPIAPLFLTMISLEEFAKRALKVVF